MIGKRLPATIGMIINQYSEAFLKRSRGCIRIVALISEVSFEELIDEEVPELEKIEVRSKKKYMWKMDSLYGTIQLAVK